MGTKIIASVTAVLLSLLTLPVLALPVLRSVPPESFLVYHVDSVPQLSFEVAYKAVVRKRLAHHFHLSEAAMCSYVRKNLVLEYLKAPLRTRVYCITESGKEFYVIMTLKKGSAVFAQRKTNKPILRLVCGNPLVEQLPPAPKIAPVKPVHPPVARVEAAKLLYVAPSVSTPAPVLTALPTVFQTAGAGQVVFSTVGSAASAGWLSGLPILAGVIAAGTSGGHPNTPPSLTPLIPNGPPTSPSGPQPVPEPNSLIPILLGALLICLTAALRRRRSCQPLRSDSVDL